MVIPKDPDDILKDTLSLSWPVDQIDLSKGQQVLSQETGDQFIELTLSMSEDREKIAELTLLQTYDGATHLTTCADVSLGMEYFRETTAELACLDEQGCPGSAVLGCDEGCAASEQSDCFISCLETHNSCQDGCFAIHRDQRFADEG
jgi:hypothetical protein